MFSTLVGWQSSTNEHLKTLLLWKLTLISICSETLHSPGILPDLFCTRPVLPSSTGQAPTGTYEPAEHCFYLLSSS